MYSTNRRSIDRLAFFFEGMVLRSWLDFFAAFCYAASSLFFFLIFGDVVGGGGGFID